MPSSAQCCDTPIQTTASTECVLLLNPHEEEKIISLTFVSQGLSVYSFQRIYISCSSFN
jgi:hypothetical protein